MKCFYRCVTTMAVFWIVAPLVARSDDPPKKGGVEPRVHEASKLEISAQEQEILDLVNQARKEEGLEPLKPNALLFQAARDHAKNMAKQQKLEYVLDGKNTQQRLKAIDYKSSQIAENIGSGKNQTPKGEFERWMDSPPHKGNILSKDYTEIGIGIADDGNGEVYYSQVFGANRESVPPQQKEPKELGKPEKEPSKLEISAEEQEIIDLVNQARKEQGLAPLKPNPLLFRSARDHSKNMAKQRKLDHVLDGKNPSQRVKEIGYKSGSVGVGENVASGMNQTPKGAFESWMDSPRHKANILNKGYNEIGIGIADDGNGKVYYTQVFGAAAGPVRKKP